MSEQPQFNPKVPIPRTAYTTAKAAWAAGVALTVAVGLFVKGIADGNLSLDEGLETVGALVAVGVAWKTVYEAEYKPKGHRA